MAAEVLSIHDKEGNVKPFRIRVDINDELVVIDKIKINSVFKAKDKIVYKCDIVINEMIKHCMLTFYKFECKWFIKL